MSRTDRTHGDLTPHVDAHDGPHPDSAPHASGSLLHALQSALGDAVSSRASDRLSMAHDASHYLLVPQAVVTARNAADVAALLRVSASHDVPLTFRSGGTSLSGQASTDGVLVDTRRHFRQVEVLDGGKRVRVQPGATVRSVNARLAPYHRKLGPDPASETACTIGGVVANNSSGMACGIEANTYQTLESAVLVLPSGTVIDTSAPNADDRFRTLEPRMHAGLADLRKRVVSNPASLRTIERLYAIKNTMGYGLNAFVDHTRPVDILLRLVIGSEGTLAFVAEATFQTVAVHSAVATSLLVFPTLTDATGALPALVDTDLTTIELLDATSLRVAQRDPHSPQVLQQLRIRDHAALLVEHQQTTPIALGERIQATAATAAGLPTAGPTNFTTDANTRGALWRIRKGLYATVAGNRPSGTTALLEDIAVPVEKLLPTCRSLTDLFARHSYTDSVIFGHAKDGNIHFMLNENFNRPEQLARYLAFTEELVDLVLGHGGTLKAEHGTGRMMAPFVRRQYGDELYDVMCEVKTLIDPHRVLNPGVVLAEDPTGHVTHLKSTPTVEPEVDRCVDCGYCEPVCPSKDLTTTPRRRIALRREMARASAAGDVGLLHELGQDYRYEVIDTCAVDGMCATACPLGIDTGDLTRRLREEQTTTPQRLAWTAAARRWDGVTRVASTALTGAHTMPPKVPTALTRMGRAVLGPDVVPAWSKDLPRGGARRRAIAARDPQAVYFPSCTSTIFDAADQVLGVEAAFLELCERTGVTVTVPDNIAALCCGTPWKSKGFPNGLDVIRHRTRQALTSATDEGRLPVIVDASSCTEGLRTALASIGIVVRDVVDFVDEHIRDRLIPVSPVRTVVVHPTCSSSQLGLNAAVERLASVIADQVVVPTQWGCCGFAGDRGLLHPELTASATKAEAKEVANYPDAIHVSVNRTCEIGMSRGTGHTYRHVIEVLAEVSRPTLRHT